MESVHYVIKTYYLCLPPNRQVSKLMCLQVQSANRFADFLCKTSGRLNSRPFHLKMGGGYLQIILRNLPIRLPCKTYRQIGLPAGLASRSNWQSLCPTQSPTSPREPHGSLRHAGVTPWPPRTVFLHGMGRQGAGVSNITQARHKAPMIMKRQF